MSDIFEDTRQRLMKVVRDFHAAEYPSLEVNYPDRFITDVEKVSGPFITVELTMRSRAMGLPLKNLVRVSGELVLNYYVREGAGLADSTKYTDALMTYLGLSTIDRVTYLEVLPYDNSGIPGFSGTMNSIEFYIDHTNLA